MSRDRGEDIDGDEQLARFILTRRYIRQDNTVKPEAFIPPSDLNLSVTRHGTLTEEAVWACGDLIADAQNKDLHGRADVVTQAVRSGGLEVQAAPVPENPNHANIAGWPPEKPRQKVLAQLIAAAAEFRRRD